MSPKNRRTHNSQTHEDHKTVVRERERKLEIPATKVLLRTFAEAPPLQTPFNQPSLLLQSSPLPTSFLLPPISSAFCISHLHLHLHFISQQAMKFIPSILRGGSKKKRSRISKADPSSFSSGSGSSTSSGSDSSVHLKETPKSILPSSCFSSTDGRLLLEIFNLFDHDRDGKITRHELEFLFTRLRVAPPSQEEVCMMLQEADQDGDGCISFEEFGALSSAFGPAGHPELRDAFDHFDSDGDGKISAEELLGFFSALGGDDGCTLEECRRMIAGVDREGKGFVGYDDFVRMMEGMET